MIVGAVASLPSRFPMEVCARPGERKTKKTAIFATDRSSVLARLIIVITTILVVTLIVVHVVATITIALEHDRILTLTLIIV